MPANLPANRSETNPAGKLIRPLKMSRVAAMRPMLVLLMPSAALSSGRISREPERKTWFIAWPATAATSTSARLSAGRPSSLLVVLDCAILHQLQNARDSGQTGGAILGERPEIITRSRTGLHSLR